MADLKQKVIVLFQDFLSAGGVLSYPDLKPKERIEIDLPERLQKKKLSKEKRKSYLLHRLEEIAREKGCTYVFATRYSMKGDCIVGDAFEPKENFNLVSLVNDFDEKIKNKKYKGILGIKKDYEEP